MYYKVHFSNSRAVLSLRTESSESAGPSRSLSPRKWASFPFTRFLVESVGLAHVIRSMTCLVNEPGLSSARSPGNGSEHESVERQNLDRL